MKSTILFGACVVASICSFQVIKNDVLWAACMIIWAFTFTGGVLAMKDRNE